MSKKIFESPKMEIIRLHTADIITTSTNAFDGEWVPIGASDNEENNDFLIH